MGILIRDATPEERAKATLSLVDGWCGVCEEDGEVTGHICLSMGMGEVFGHDTAYWGNDPTAPTRMWFAARKKAREMGANAVNVHFDGNTDDRIKDFWIRLGFEPVMTIYRRNI